MDVVEVCGYIVQRKVKKGGHKKTGQDCNADFRSIKKAPLGGGQRLGKNFFSTKGGGRGRMNFGTSREKYLGQSKENTIISLRKGRKGNIVRANYSGGKR